MLPKPKTKSIHVSKSFLSKKKTEWHGLAAKAKIPKDMMARVEKKMNDQIRGAK